VYIDDAIIWIIRFIQAHETETDMNVVEFAVF
jgi:hypothetical protein